MSSIKTKAFEKLENTISIYNGFYYQFESIFNNHRIAISKNIRPNGLSKSFIHASRLAYISAIDGKLEMAKMYEVSLENFDGTMADIELNNCNFYAVQVFESLETYLKDFLTLYNLNDLYFDLESERFNEERKKVNRKKFLELVDQAVKRNSNLEEALKFSSLDYIIWSDVFRSCRHAITHGSGLLKKYPDTTSCFHLYVTENLKVAKIYLNQYFDVHFEDLPSKINTRNTVQEIFKEALRFGTLFEKYLQPAADK